MNRHKFLLLFVCFTILLTGCWDSINLEERAFIVGTAIDLADKNEDNEKHPTFSVTNQIVIPAGVGVTGSEGGGGEEKPFLNITSTGTSIYSLDEELAAKSSKVPFYEHFEILIISEEIART